MQPTPVIMVIIFGVQSPEGATFTLHVYILPEIRSKIHQSVRALQTSEELQTQ